MAAPKATKDGAAPKPASRDMQGCPIGDVLHLLGEPYVLDLLHLLLTNRRPWRFVDLQRELKMSPNTLTDRLHRLVKAGLFTRTAYQEIPPRVEYALTPKAEEFEGVFADLNRWAGKHNLQPEPTVYTPPG